ncbi:MAG: hypothetical protein J1D87_01300 [Lachnospiraceae bacterium]|nr:hypothetical protein [Lachnospiraceae bacterium]
MVNKIDGNNYYDYQKLKNVNIPDTGEKFSLDYKQNELQSESKKDNEDKDEKASAVQNSTEDKSGVRLELSRQGQSAAFGRPQSASASKSQEIVDVQSIIKTIRDYISTAITAVKDFFYNLWYDNPRPEADIQAAIDNAEVEEMQENADVYDELETALERAELHGFSDSAEGKNNADIDARTTYRMNNEKLDRRIQPYLKSGDLNQVINLLTDNGRKSIARNSSLLTYYDKTGRMVEPNASDRERILHGDGNTRKL